VLAAALEEGRAAIEAGDKDTAIERFELALAVDANNADAQAGLDRALKLDQVLELMRTAAAHEVLSEWSDAASVYRAVLELDPQWGPAGEGLGRVQATTAGNEYDSHMSTGYTALADERYEQARRAFQQALRMRPGDVDASAGLAQVESENQLAEILALREEGRRLEDGEQWDAAAARYEQILSLDATLQEAKQAVARARQRAELNQRLDYENTNPDRLNDDANWKAANQLLDYARAIDPSGPVLASQINRLAKTLELAQIPLPVRFESDNLTEVVVYKVGKLGTFVNRTLDLKPGAYVAVGTRAGYRDVRRNFRVVPDGAMSPVVVRCEEPI
jgi:tetratricopeptide (TPR) repeat protein